jgi:hypothetical protein
LSQQSKVWRVYKTQNDSRAEAVYADFVKSTATLADTEIRRIKFDGEKAYADKQIAAQTDRANRLQADLDIAHAQQRAGGEPSTRTAGSHSQSAHGTGSGAGAVARFATAGPRPSAAKRQRPPDPVLLASQVMPTNPTILGVVQLRQFSAARKIPPHSNCIDWINRQFVGRWHAAPWDFRSV